MRPDKMGVTTLHQTPRWSFSYGLGELASAGILKNITKLVVPITTLNKANFKRVINKNEPPLVERIADPSHPSVQRSTNAEEIHARRCDERSSLNLGWLATAQDLRELTLWSDATLDWSLLGTSLPHLHTLTCSRSVSRQPFAALFPQLREWTVHSFRDEQVDSSPHKICESLTHPNFTKLVMERSREHPRTAHGQ